MLKKILLRPIRKKKKTKKEKADPTAESERVMKALRVMTSAKEGYISGRTKNDSIYLDSFPMLNAYVLNYGWKVPSQKS